MKRAVWQTECDCCGKPLCKDGEGFNAPFATLRTIMGEAFDVCSICQERSVVDILLKARHRVSNPHSVQL